MSQSDDAAIWRQRCRAKPAQEGSTLGPIWRIDTKREEASQCEFSDGQVSKSLSTLTSETRSDADGIQLPRWTGASLALQGMCGCRRVHGNRKGKAMESISETTATPPYILGNFPRIEIVFDCIDKPVTRSGSGR
jgi:hypothetical protein